MSELWSHQKMAVEKARGLKSLAIFFQMGTGKTATTIEILREIYNSQRRMMRTLIVCPNSVTTNWPLEIEKFSKIDPRFVQVLDGALIKRSEMYRRNWQGISITNFESLAFDRFTDSVLETPPEILIIDESQRVKSMQARRTKFLIKLTDKMRTKPFSRVYILTGTPVLNSEIDLFSQFRILDGGETFGTNFYQFRSRFFYDAAAFMKGAQRSFSDWRIKKGSEELIKKLMAPKVVQAKKEECLDLPPLVKTEVRVDLSIEQLRAYDEMKKDFLAFVSSGVATASLAITKALRMQQIISGFLKLEDGSIHRFKENPRATILSDLLEDIAPANKTIVWAIFQEDYATIYKCMESLGLKYASITGLVKDKQAELDRFREDPECRVMVASPAAGGVGINMIAANTMIYYSRSYNLEHDLQSEARNYRGGSEIHEKITRIDLVASKTVDEVVLKALRNKQDLASRILDLKNLL